MKKSKRFELNQNRRVWGRKGYSCCNTPAKNLQNLRPAASKVMILRLWHDQDSQVAIYIDTQL